MEKQTHTQGEGVRMGVVLPRAPGSREAEGGPGAAPPRGAPGSAQPCCTVTSHSRPPDVCDKARHMLRAIQSMELGYGGPRESMDRAECGQTAGSHQQNPGGSLQGLEERNENHSAVSGRMTGCLVMPSTEKEKVCLQQEL